MTLTHFLSVLKARWISALLVFAIALSAVLAWGLLRPKQYTAVASIVVDVKSPDPIAGMVLQGVTSPSFMVTQLDVIQSTRVARRMVKNLKLDEHPVLRAQWQKRTDGEGNIEAWLAETFRKGLDARPSRGSNVINVAYTSSDPKFAAAIADGFVQSYLETTLELRVDPAKQYSTFFDARGKKLREGLEQAQARLSEYQQKNGLIATDERLDVENVRLSELSSQLVALQAAAAESGGRLTQAGANAERMQEVLNNPVVAALSADLARQQVKLKETGQRLGDQHPQVQELRASIDELRGRITAATSKVSGSVGVTDSVNQTRLAQVRASIDEQRAKVLRLKGQRDEAAVLQRDVENAQRAYDGVLARLNQTSLESQSGQTNITALEQAVIPTEPSSISLRQSLLIGLLLGSILACVTALGREWRDRRVRMAAGLPQITNQPLIGVVPSFAKREPSLLSSRRLLIGAKRGSVPAA
jgi:polysaccharide biosynthesis transport protein